MCLFNDKANVTRRTKSLFFDMELDGIYAELDKIEITNELTITVNVKKREHEEIMQRHKIANLKYITCTMFAQKK